MNWEIFRSTRLGYNSNPRKLQAAIRKIYELATKQIVIEGTRVVPKAFYDVMNGTDTRMYVHRVEPSEVGGELMSLAIWDTVKDVARTEKPPSKTSSTRAV
jgi:hypothetical protein